jgi:N-acetylmuramoyl-L-alanine amidase
LFGVDYVDARDFAERFGLSPGWLEPQKKLRLQSQWTTIELAVHRDELSLNGTRLVLSEPVVAQNGSLYFAKGDAELVLAPILSPPAAGTSRVVKTIVVDAGHGGEDPGKQNHGLKLDEKTFTLDVAKRLERLLKAADFRVVMTRKNDRTVELDERVAIAEKAHADVFVSIHFNAFTDAAVAGAETFVTTPHRQPSSPARENDTSMIATAFPGNRHDGWNAVLGYQVHRHLAGQLKSPDRGLKHFRYHVLRMVDCPAVLVEAAFISNAAEARQITSAAYRQQLAETIAAGLKAYAAAVDRSAGRKVAPTRPGRRG